MNQFNLVLDLDKSESRTPTVRLRQGDQDGTVIAAAIYDHGAALSGTVTACAIVMKLPDGTHYYRKGATWADGVATVTIDERQAASVVGRTVLAYFTLTVGDAQYSTGAFAVIVEPDAVGDAELPESVDDAIEAYVDAWLTAHPEATTTVQDGAVTSVKLASSLTRAVLIGQGSVTASTYSTLLPDADGAARGTLWCVTGGYDSILHLPVAKHGFLLTYGTGKLTSTTSQAVQLYYTIGSTGTTQATDTRLYFRTRWGASNSPWGEWEHVATIDDVKSSSAPYADVSMFRKVGVLGDSFASGSMYVNDEFVTSDYEQGWPMNLSRQHGVEVLSFRRNVLVKKKEQ